MIWKYINDQGKEVQIEFGMSWNLIFDNKNVKGMERLNEDHILAIDENEIKIYKY